MEMATYAGGNASGDVCLRRNPERPRADRGPVVFGSTPHCGSIGFGSRGPALSAPSTQRGSIVKANELMFDVANVMADVLVHQRARWGSLLGHQRQYEGWWKAEMALALESWTWREDRQAWPVYVQPEAKPAAFDLAGPATVDLVVARVNSALNDFDYRARPRVWIELKERGTWWGTSAGDAAKAFGTANKGLLSDLEKWKGVKAEGEVVLVCQVTMHDGTYKDRLPQTWKDQLAIVAKQYERVVERCVGFEIAGQDRVRWTRFDAFIVNRGW